MGSLDVTPADLLKAADDYAVLAQRTAVIGPQAAEEVERVIASHGPMGYPTAVGIVAGLESREAQVSAKAADFATYAQRFAEHAATYQSVDADGARRMNQATLLDMPGAGGGDAPRVPGGSPVADDPDPPVGSVIVCEPYTAGGGFICWEWFLEGPGTSFWSPTDRSGAWW
ncbi:type VII secretion target [Mycobacterium xenopi]|uniref:type VII secretion target n=1 Tax=Mycobacterium xenopi TaxID=1789 RepID=UPI000A156D43|nr:type VII secretion target [Mycobacterium xenopi]ORX11373.1 hypothetical protein AWC32_16805 [Mycobacterium xenopi]SPX94907.1 Protein of uncharacterised function (DUF2580) [Mycobacterium xenopi]